MTKPKVAIVYLAYYHDLSFLTAAADSIAALHYPKELLEFIVVVNPHATQGSYAPTIREHLLPQSGLTLPQVTILEQAENLGFARGNQAGLDDAIERNCTYALLLNNDASLHPQSITRLVEALETDPSIGVAQPLIVLDPERTKINSAGNAVHFLGFGYCNYYLSPVTQAPSTITDIGFASGAAVLMRLELVKKYGGLEHAFFMYHEDLEYSVRLRMLGYRSVLVPSAVAYHHYEFSRSMNKYYFMERNRFAFLLITYKLPTLLLLAPLLLCTELALFVFAWRGGWLPERLKAYRYWFTAEAWQTWLPKRRSLQELRRVSDRELLSHTTGSILFQETQTTSPIVTHFANPILSLALRFLQTVIVW
jgi:GT2 family glycosyltransferase